MTVIETYEWHQAWESWDGVCCREHLKGSGHQHQTQLLTLQMSSRVGLKIPAGTTWLFYRIWLLPRNELMTKWDRRSTEETTFFFRLFSRTLLVPEEDNTIFCSIVSHAKEWSKLPMLLRYIVSKPVNAFPVPRSWCFWRWRNSWLNHTSLAMFSLTAAKAAVVVITWRGSRKKQEALLLSGSTRSLLFVFYKSLLDFSTRNTCITSSTLVFLSWDGRFVRQV